MNKQTIINPNSPILEVKIHRKSEIYVKKKMIHTFDSDRENCEEIAAERDGEDNRPAEKNLAKNFTQNLGSICLFYNRIWA